MRLALAGLLVAVAVAPARADDAAKVRARALDEQGRAAHDAGDYAGAIRAYKEAYVLAPSPGVLFNLAQAYRLSGDCTDAVLMYHTYLATNPGDDERAIAELHLANVSRCATPPPPPPVPRPPGVTGVVAMTSLTVAAPLPTSPGRTERRFGVGVAIAGTALLAGSLYFAIDAHEAANDVSRFYAMGGSYKSIAETDARGRSSQHWAEGLGIAGGVAIVAGGALYYLGYRAEQPPIDIAVTAHGARASVAWRF